MIAQRARPGSGLHRLAWIYMRLTAVLMLGLVMGHLYIVHVLNSTDTIDFQFVAQRFATPFWRIYDGFLLFFALSHGLVGVRGIFDDYIRSRRRRVIAESVLWALGTLFFILGAFVLMTFRPGLFR